ncbi:Nuclear protein localization protein 4 [Cyberlindnera fabianii]|nr:Nuclear protein localization protein 4 [Cyberlindnera fabianii]
MLRVTADKSSDLLQAIALNDDLKKLDPSAISVSKTPNGPFEPLPLFAGKSLTSLGFSNGEQLHLQVAASQTAQPIATTTSGKTFVEIPKFAQGPGAINELAVDKELDKEDGMIPRQKSRLCSHGDKGMCDHCSPLPPWNKEYREENSIKHASFHAHVKYLDHSTNKGQGSSYMAPLTESDFAIDKNCTNGHEPWPRGICSKCQPAPITLQQQEFRMVDHVEFSSFDIINSFIDSWRQTGTQRIGYMYGTYQKYNKVPLGIKAVVEAIYEPNQHDENDGLTMEVPWKDEESIDKIAKMCGLEKLGVIFTDLTDARKGDGSVLCKRHKDSYFLTSLEVIMAAKFQKQYPNATHHSDSGKFSSKFITCVISGNKEGEIDISPYQVSEGAEALVAADMITGSTKPSFAYINETNDDRYVPDIFYTKFNEYKLQVKTNAKPAIPVDYLLVTLSHGFPQDPNPVFASNSFPIENRQALGVSQDLQTVKSHLKIDSPDQNDVIKQLSNFHLLCYLFSTGILSPEEEKLAAKVATGHKLEDAYLLTEQPGWQTLLTIMRSS